MEKMNFCGALCALCNFMRKKLAQFYENSFVIRRFIIFIKLSLSNIIKHGERHVEQQLSIQGIHLRAIWNYFWK